ncbi:hypothetical protein E5676_scaffold313G001580 [Cucumis melo var. makuwa]|uniref:Uncharacterized protein n=1 Tax=Cucumis melo var. makuwa TaxID=1194695 RepID=A0A5D3DS28_CUCMM|nr:hypothetical protein E5676_scaffold313G001580 [Cucumis melo var. makuwa]
MATATATIPTAMMVVTSSIFIWVSPRLGLIVVSNLLGPCCLESTPFSTFRTRQVNLQVRDSTTSSMLRIMRLSCYVWRELLWLYDGCRDGECNEDLSDMLYADAMCMYTAIRGPRIPTVLGVPRGTEDQSYVPTGAHVARVQERARNWVEDEARARASWRATRSDRGGP